MEYNEKYASQVEVVVEKKRFRNNILIITIFILVAILSINIKLSIVGIALIFLITFLYKPLWWVYFMLTYLTFEILIQNFVPGSLVGVLRYGTEGFSYIVLFTSIIISLAKKRKVKLYIYDKSIIAFILFSIIAALINDVDTKIFIMGLRWLVRYVVIYFIFKFNSFSKTELKRLVKYFYFLIIIQLSIGLLQFVFRSKLDVILKQKVIELEYHTIESVQSESKYAIFSTFGRYGEYAYFVTLAVTFLFAKYVFDKKKRSLVLLGIALVVLILTYARQAAVGVIISILFYIYFNRDKRSISKTKISAILVIITISVGIYFVYNDFQRGKGVLGESMSQRYLSIFSIDFIKEDYSGKGRTYFLTTVNKKFIENKPLIGYGVGMYGTEPAIKYDQSVYTELNIPTRFSMDVYWISILGQLGLVGIFLLFRCYYLFYRECKSNYINNRDFKEFISLFIRLSFIAIMIQSFFGSNLSDRYQAFYIWMFFGIFDSIKTIEINKEK